MNRIEVAEHLKQIALLMDAGDTEGARTLVEQLVEEFSCESKTNFEKQSGYPLSDNQYLFCCEAVAAEHEIDFNYSGRNMMRELCPAIRTEESVNFQASVKTESCGRYRKVYYAEY